ERRQHSPDGKQDRYRVGGERRSVGMDGNTDNAGIGPAREIARRMSMDRLQTGEQQQHAQTAKRSPLSWGPSLDWSQSHANKTSIVPRRLRSELPFGQGPSAAPSFRRTDSGPSRWG